VQNNLGFEALTLVKDASSDPFRVFVATENALFQDQQDLSLEQSSEPGDRSSGQPSLRLIAPSSTAA
jgi:hypothetical protein